MSNQPAAAAKVASKQASEQEVKAPALTRDEMRAKLIGAKLKPESKIVTLFGVELELRQPTLKAIMKARDIADTAERAADMIIEYAYVPGTDEHVFEDTDREIILNWPFGEGLTEVNMVIADLTGIDIEGAMEDLKKDPFKDSS